MNLYNHKPYKKLKQNATNLNLYRYHKWKKEDPIYNYCLFAFKNNSADPLFLVVHDIKVKWTQKGRMFKRDVLQNYRSFNVGTKIKQKKEKKNEKNKRGRMLTLLRSFLQRATISETLLGRYNRAIKAASGILLL